jgi:capsular polysaccharide transport system permease protein
MRNRAALVLFFLIFVLPLAAVAVYEVAYATDRYESSSSIVITEEQGTATGVDLSILGLPAPSSSKDALVTLEFINSLDMLKYLDAKFKLRAHFSAPDIDWWAQLPAGASQEDFHDYLPRYLQVAYDTDSQIISIHFQGFDREYAKSVVDAVVARSQEFIDKLNSKITTEQTAFFEQQLKNSEVRVKEVKTQLLKFQRENRLLTTETQAALVNSNISELDKMLIAKRGELATRLKELNDNSPVIQVLRTEIDSLQNQLNQERDRLSGGTSAAVTELDAQFREIEFNLEFVTNLYKSNLAQLEQAHIDAIRRLKYLIVVTQPALADASIYPDRVYIVGTAAMLLLLVYFIVSLLVAIIREHA